MFQGIKSFLKKFLPPPVNVFNREIEQLHLSISQIQQEVRHLNDQTKHESQQCLDIIKHSNTNMNKILNEQQSLATCMSKFEEEFKEQICALKQGIKQVNQSIPYKPIYWSNSFERTVVQENWGDVTAKPDFVQKFLRLTSGMDAASVENIIRIISRQKKYLHSNQEEMDLFTYKEQTQLRQLKEIFDIEILQLSNDLYAYKNYLLPINHFEPSVFYYKHGLNQVKNLEHVRGKGIIDVGGFIGDSILVLSELLPSTIYSFEAVPDNYEMLRKTVEINCINNVVAENVALGDREGTLTLHVAGSGSTAIDRPGIHYKENIKVPVTTLDNYVAKNKLDIGLIKVDIEGGEPAFLYGSKRTICEQKPILLLSIYHNAHDFFELKPLIESWNLGYRFSIHKPTNASATSETLLIAEVIFE